MSKKRKKSKKTRKKIKKTKLRKKLKKSPFKRKKIGRRRKRVKKVRKKGAKDGKNTYDYLHLVQTTRTPKGPRQQLLLNLGTLPIKKDEWRVFAKEVERRVTGQEVIVKPRLNQRLKQCIEKTVHRLAEKQGQEIKVPDITKEKGRCIQKVDTHSIKTKSHQSIGVEHICHEAYKQLEIDEFLKDKKVSKIKVYLPIQKSLNIDPKISSTSTFPTIIPKCLVANLRSSAALSKSSSLFF